MSPQASAELDSRVVVAPQRVGVKLFLENPEWFDRDRMIDIFHRWIQQDRLPGTLVDVHDYTHVPEGPGVLLVAHRWHLRTDQAGGRIGLEYELKRDTVGTLAERLSEAIAGVLEAAAALEQDTSDENPARFDTREMVFRFTDRLAVPATEAAFEEVSRQLEGILSHLYGGGKVELDRTGHARGPLTLHAHVGGEGGRTLTELASEARAAAR